MSKVKRKIQSNVTPELKRMQKYFILIKERSAERKKKFVKLLNGCQFICRGVSHENTPKPFINL